MLFVQIRHVDAHSESQTINELTAQTEGKICRHDMSTSPRRTKRIPEINELALAAQTEGKINMLLHDNIRETARLTVDTRSRSLSRNCQWHRSGTGLKNSFDPPRQLRGSESLVCLFSANRRLIGLQCD